MPYTILSSLCDYFLKIHTAELNWIVIFYDATAQLLV